MSSNKKVIRFAFKAAVILVILTYLISLNISYGLFDLKWLSNNFLLTIVGGAFASMLVVLMCEVQKYFENKKAVEEKILYHTTYLYGQFLILQKLIEKDVESKETPLSEGMYKLTESNVELHLNELTKIDYCSLKNECEVSKALNDFSSQTIVKLRLILSNFRNLDTAIVSDKILNLKTYGQERRVTSNSPCTGKSLKIQLRDINIALSKIDTFISVVDNGCNGRLKWDKVKAELLTVWHNTPEFGFDAYINQEV